MSPSAASPKSQRIRRIVVGTLGVFGFFGIFGVLGVAPAKALDPTKPLDRFVHEIWTTDDGLPQNSINDILQTRDGYLWLATFGGLARFDGVRFTVFDAATTPGLESNRLTALTEGPDGTLWIGSELGHLIRRQGGRFETFRPRSGLPESYIVWDLLAEADGSVWLATSSGVARAFEGRVAELYTEAQGLFGSSSGSMLRASSGAIWIGGGGGVARLEAGTIRRFESLLPRSDLVYGLTEVDGGRVWAGIRGGIAELSSETARFIVGPDTRQHYLGAFLVDRGGSLWYTRRGLVRRPADPALPIERLLDDVSIRSLYEDREGHLWIGTGGEGLHRLREGIFETATSSEGLLITAIREDAPGEMLVGTACEGLKLWRDGTLSDISLPSQQLLCIYAVLRDRRGRLWVGSRSLGVSDDDGWTLHTEDNDGPLGVTSLYEDRRGAVWVGTRQGLLRFEGSPPRRDTVDGGLTGSYVAFITEDRAGNLWIGTADGMSRFEGGVVSPETATSYTTADGLRHDFVRAIHEDERGVLWIGTYGGGLSRLENGVFSHLSVREGLRENMVSSILEDDSGHFWLGGNRGVSRLDPADADAFARGEIDRIATRLFDTSSGLPAAETNGGFQPAAWKSSDGRLWFPTIRGLAVVDPTELRETVPPTAVIEAVRVGHRTLELADTIRVPPGRWDLEVEYTALRLAEPRELRFRYRLAGHADAWTEAGPRRTAYYTQVPPGTYRFEVAVAAHEGGAWSVEPASFEVVFEPFLWQTHGFRGLVVLFGIGLFLAVFLLWTGHTRRRNATLETVNAALRDQQATNRRVISELEAQNNEMERFLYTVSHDLKSPLFTIRGFTGLARRDAVGGDAAALDRDLERIGAAADTMARLLDELLELAQIGRVLHTPRLVPLADVVREAAELASGILGERGVEVEIDDALPAVFADRRRLVEVFDNLLDNAARAMDEVSHPRVEILVRGHDEDNGLATVHVRDNGKGIEPRYLEKIFGLFERIDTEREGTGIGLALCRRIVEYHGGRIRAESRGPKTGTTFILTLPTRMPTLDQLPPRPAPEGSSPGRDVPSRPRNE